MLGQWFTLVIAELFIIASQAHSSDTKHVPPIQGAIITAYLQKLFHSEDQYECHAGTVIAGTTLRGKVFKLAN